MSCSPSIWKAKYSRPKRLSFSVLTFHPPGWKPWRQDHLGATADRGSCTSFGTDFSQEKAGRPSRRHRFRSGAVKWSQSELCSRLNWIARTLFGHHFWSRPYRGPIYGRSTNSRVALCAIGMEPRTAAWPTPAAQLWTITSTYFEPSLINRATRPEFSVAIKVVAEPLAA